MPYTGPGDKNLPKQIKALTRHQRDVFVSAFNSAYEAKLAETTDKKAAEKHAFAVATAAAKKAPKAAPNESAAKTVGEGQGVGGERQGDGGVDTCVCSECGYEAKHDRGTPCAERTCPTCGATMAGKASKPAAAGTAKKTMSKELKFTATVPFLKAWKEGGKRFISMLASSDTTDKAAERVVPEFIAKMREDAEGGKIDLLENHSDVIPIARSVGVVDGAEVWDAAVAKGCKASGPESIFVPKFELDEEHPMADKVYQKVASGDCDWQCSIGGKAVAKKVFDKDTATIVQELWPGSIDHIALTRNGAACNPDTMMFGAVMKSAEWAEIEAPEPEASPEKPEAVQAAMAGDEMAKATENDVRDRIQQALREKYPTNDDVFSPWLQSLETVPEEGDCIIERDGKYFRLHYTITESGVVFSDEVEVEQVWAEKAADASPDLLQAATQLSSTVDAVIAKLESDRVTLDQVREIIRDELAKQAASGDATTEQAESAPVAPQEPSDGSGRADTAATATDAASEATEPETPSVEAAKETDAATDDADQVATPPVPADAGATLLSFLSEMTAKLQAILTPPEPATAKSDAESADGADSAGDETETEKADAGEPQAELSEIDVLKRQVATLTETEKADAGEPQAELSEIDVLKRQVATLTGEIETLKKAPDPSAKLPVAGTRVYEAEKTIGDGSAEVGDDPVTQAIAAARAAKGSGPRAEFLAKEAAQKAIANLVRDL